MVRSALPALGEADVEAYERDGVVRVPGLLDAGWVARMRRAIDRIERNPGPFASATIPTTRECS